MSRQRANWGEVLGVASLVVALLLGAVGWWMPWYPSVNQARADYPLPPPQRTVYFDSASYGVTEGGTATITVLLSSAADEAVTVDYEVVDEYDNVLASGTITFAPGETSYSYPCTAPDYNCPNPDVVVTLRLVNPQGGNTGLGELSTATLTITDNDG